MTFVAYYAGEHSGHGLVVTSRVAEAAARMGTARRLGTLARLARCAARMAVLETGARAVQAALVPT